MQRLDPETGKLSKSDTTLYSLASRRPLDPPAVEAPFIVRRGSYYYLFVSFDICCRGKESTYKIMVGRSANIMGPYADKDGKPMMEGGGTLVLEGAETWRGPGHMAVLFDKDADRLVFHAYHATTGRPALQISAMVWDEGWPRVGTPAMTNLTRREFGALLAAAPLAAASRMDERPGPRPGAPAKRRCADQGPPLSPRKVRLLSGSFYTLQDRNRSYLHTLDSDRLLHTFRLTAGLPSKAVQLGGWERPDIELRGHFLGHYLTACGLMYSSAGDDLLKTKAAAIVAELGKCQKANGGGWLSAFPADFMQRLTERLPVWAPWYTLHKILAGLLDLYQHCGNEQALDIALAMVGWTQKWAAGIGDDDMARLLQVEYGGMNEFLYNLHARDRRPGARRAGAPLRPRAALRSPRRGTRRAEGPALEYAARQGPRRGEALRADRRGTLSPHGRVLLGAGRRAPLVLHGRNEQRPALAHRARRPRARARARPRRSAAARTTCSSSRGTSSPGIPTPAIPISTSALSSTASSGR